MTGIELKMILETLEFSQIQFANKIDVSETTISNWITGKHPVPRVVKLYLDLLYELRKLSR